jgi:hypothetical protein
VVEISRVMIYELVHTMLVHIVQFNSQSQSANPNHLYHIHRESESRSESRREREREVEQVNHTCMLTITMEHLSWVGFVVVVASQA